MLLLPILRISDADAIAAIDYCFVIVCKRDFSSRFLIAVIARCIHISCFTSLMIIATAIDTLSLIRHDIGYIIIAIIIISWCYISCHYIDIDIIA